MTTLDYSAGREQALRRLIDGAGLCLEIGPSYNPILPKRAGHRVKTVDHCDAAELRAKYAAQPEVDAAKIEEVDHVWRGEPLAGLVGPGRFDVVVASHVIEHTPDMLGFLQECERALKPDGRLLLAVPDRRRTFDFFRPASTTGAVLQAHHERRTRHAPGAAFDFIANFCTFGGRQSTADGDASGFTLSNSVVDAAAGFAHYARAGGYDDCHAWVFTPSSFRLIASDLAAIGALGLREAGFWGTSIFEFVALLSREAAGCPLDRADLVVAAHREAGEPQAPLPAARSGAARGAESR
jgi:SAM-dependent methyltransferase